MPENDQTISNLISFYLNQALNRPDETSNIIFCPGYPFIKSAPTIFKYGFVNIYNHFDFNNTNVPKAIFKQNHYSYNEYKSIGNYLVCQIEKFRFDVLYKSFLNRWYWYSDHYVKPWVLYKASIDFSYIRRGGYNKILNFGKHKGVPLQHVPFDYLLWAIENIPWFTSVAFRMTLVL